MFYASREEAGKQTHRKEYSRHGGRSEGKRGQSGSDDGGAGVESLDRIVENQGIDSCSSELFYEHHEKKIAVRFLVEEE